MPTEDGIPATYQAGCDVCSYVARIESDNDEAATRKLAEDLAAHNFEAHDAATDVDSIIEPVKAKMTITSE